MTTHRLVLLTIKHGGRSSAPVTGTNRTPNSSRSGASAHRGRHWRFAEPLTVPAHLGRGLVGQRYGHDVEDRDGVRRPTRRAGRRTGCTGPSGGEEERNGEHPDRVTVIAWITTLGRGYLLPLGFALAMLALGNVFAKTGWAEWFPWSIVPLSIGTIGQPVQTCPRSATSW